MLPRFDFDLNEGYSAWFACQFGRVNLYTNTGMNSSIFMSIFFAKSMRVFVLYTFMKESFTLNPCQFLVELLHYHVLDMWTSI